MSIVVIAACMTASVLAGLRWLRVAQREHYLPGSVLLFAERWWFILAYNRLIAAAAVAAAIGGFFAAPLGLATALAVAIAPLGLSVRGRSSKLQWTRRLRTLGAISSALYLFMLACGLLVGAAVPAVLLATLGVPVLVDIASAFAQPVERRRGQHFVDAAAARLKAVDPVVVAITGSFGKTTTKQYVAHIIGKSRPVAASPASYNNRPGLAKAVNEGLLPDTEVFVAEMGTYGAGEIAEICEWMRPKIAVITAVGPVHLERFGTEDNILEAKSEILEHAEVAILNIDDRRLAVLADRVSAAGKRVVRCSASNDTADVAALPDSGRLKVFHDKEQIADVEAEPAGPANVACAVAVALELGVDKEAIAAALPTLPVPDHRLSAAIGSTGATILDDTYNSNPMGVRAALQMLERRMEPDRRAVVVTPGMVELGARQDDENEEFARLASQVATDIIVVGHTNRAALMGGAAAGPARIVVLNTRDDAVRWVRAHVSAGDVVLYENDLPDHYP